AGKTNYRTFAVDMPGELLSHVVERKLLRIDPDSCYFAAESPLEEAAIDSVLCNILAGWHRTGSQRKNLDFLGGRSEPERIDEPNQDRVVRPETTVGEHVDAPAAIRMVDSGQRPVNRRRRGRKAHIH